MIGTLARHLVWESYDRLRGGGVITNLRILEAAQWDPAEVVARRQWDAIGSLLEHAAERVPYYRRLLDANGLRPADLIGPDGFARLPLLSRQQVRENQAA